LSTIHAQAINSIEGFARDCIKTHILALEYWFSWAVEGYWMECWSQKTWPGPLWVQRMMVCH